MVSTELLFFSFVFTQLHAYRYPVDIYSGGIQTPIDHRYYIYTDDSKHCDGTIYTINTLDEYSVIGRAPVFSPNLKVRACSISFQYLERNMKLIASFYTSPKCIDWPSCYKVTIESGEENRFSIPTLASQTSMNCTDYKYLYSPIITIYVDDCSTGNMVDSKNFNFTIKLKTVPTTSTAFGSSEYDYIAFVVFGVLVLIGISTLLRWMILRWCFMHTEERCACGGSCCKPGSTVPRRIEVAPGYAQNQPGTSGNNSRTLPIPKVTGPPGRHSEQPPTYQEVIASTQNST